MVATDNIRSYAKVKKQVLSAPHYFALLGVHQGSNSEELAEARNALARIFHPDRNGDPAAHELMARINQAHTILSTPAQAQRYLLTLPQRHCQACKGRGYKVMQRGFTTTENTQCLTCHGSGREPS